MGKQIQQAWRGGIEQHKQQSDDNNDAGYKFHGQ